MGFEGARDSFTVPSSVGKLPLSIRKSRVHASRSIREKFMEILDSKYRKIDDHETCMRNFVLLRNCLRRLQREAKEEQADLKSMEASPADVSPSCLSPLRYSSPVPHTYQASSDEDYTAEQMSPAKRPRLSLYPNKESPDWDLREDTYKLTDDTDILRDLYETCSNNSYRSSLPSSWSSAPCLNDSSLQNSNYSLSCSLSSRDISSNDSSWFKSTCGMNSRCGGEDLRSVVYYSLVSSLES